MLAEDKLLKMYEDMLKIRYFEEKSIILFKQGVIGGSIHPYIGQEAIAAGVCAQLSKEDYVTSTHRGHGHVIAKGGDLKKMMAELIGKETGYCKGRGGSMHIADLGIGILGSNGIVGGGIPIAVGAAFRNAYKKDGRIVVCFFGDGAANEGTFHEAVNMAAIWKLPVVFVCENNQYGISTRSDYASAGESIGNRACAYGIVGRVIDGNNLLEVYQTMGEAYQKALAGEGPTLIECQTYRVEGHFVGDLMSYRDKEEAEEWKKKCPILAFEKYLLENDLVTAEDLNNLKKTIQQEVEEAVKFAEESPFPAPETILDNIYA